MSEEKTIDISDWFKDPTINFRYDPSMSHKEFERRRQRVYDAKAYALHCLPGWVQEWLIKAETLIRDHHKKQDAHPELHLDNMPIGEAYANTMPDCVPGVTEDSFDYFDALVMHLLREEYDLIRKELLT
jgi:hypothetical protein